MMILNRIEIAPETVIETEMEGTGKMTGIGTETLVRPVTAILERESAVTLASIALIAAHVDTFFVLEN